MRISVVIPTIGRSTLYRAVESYRWQMLDYGDEIIVVSDGLGVPIVIPFDGRVLHFETPATHDWGASQADFGIARAAGDVILLCGDDDFATSNALDLVRRACSSQPGAHVFTYMDEQGNKSSTQIGISQQLAMPAAVAKQFQHAETPGHGGDVAFANKILAACEHVTLHQEPILVYCQSLGRMH